MIGEAIDYYREKIGLSKASMSRALIVSNSTITIMIRKDSNPTFSTLIRVSKILGVSVSDIVIKAEQLRLDRKNS